MHACGALHTWWLHVRTLAAGRQLPLLGWVLLPEPCRPQPACLAPPAPGTLTERSCRTLGQLQAFQRQEGLKCWPMHSAGTDREGVSSRKDRS